MLVKKGKRVTATPLRTADVKNAFIGEMLQEDP